MHSLHLSSHIDVWPMLQRFGDVRRGDGVGFGEVRDRARQLEDAVEGASGELQALSGGAQEGLH